jgi:hypothetical protein
LTDFFLFARLAQPNITVTTRDGRHCGSIVLSTHDSIGSLGYMAAICVLLLCAMTLNMRKETTEGTRCGVLWGLMRVFALLLCCVIVERVVWSSCFQHLILPAIVKLMY